MAGRTPRAALAALILLAATATAQSPSSTAQLSPTVSPSLPAAPTPQSAAQILGEINAPSGSPVAAATVTLIPRGKLDQRTALSTADGTFSFTAVPPGAYRITVTAPGLDVYTSPEFVVRPSQSIALPTIALRISTATTVNVIASSRQIAVAQINEEEQQRVLGIFQNFYTSFIWDAKPMPVRQKYTMAFRSLIDPPQFVIAAAIAGVEQEQNTYSGYGQGLQGYGKRYGAILATATTSRLVGSALLPALFHQDPRYFYQGSGSIGSRTLHAISFTFVTRGDNGQKQISYSHLLGSLTAAAVANAYLPAGSRGVGTTFQTFGIDLAGNIFGNVVREFVLRRLESIPTFANGRHPKEHAPFPVNPHRQLTHYLSSRYIWHRSYGHSRIIVSASKMDEMASTRLDGRLCN